MMPGRTEALLLIDLQNDFVPGGSLAVPEGDRVVPVANAVQERFDLVIASQDWHPPDHASFARNHPGREVGERIELDGIEQVLWPVHCVQNTRGAELVADLHTGRLRRVFRKGTDPRIDSYSAFFDNGHRRATGLGDFLKEQDVTRVYMLGLATDYCVKFSVLDARELGFEVILIEDGCRGVELAEGDVERAKYEMRQRGTTLISSRQLLS